MWAEEPTCCWATKPCQRVHPSADGEALLSACGFRIVEPLPDLEAETVMYDSRL